MKEPVPPAQVICQSESARARDHGMQGDIAEFGEGLLQQGGERFSDVGKMPLIVREEDCVVFIQNSDLDGRGTDVNAKSADFVSLVHRVLPPAFSIAYADMRKAMKG